MKVTITIADETIRNMLDNARASCAYWLRSYTDLRHALTETITVYEQPDDGEDQSYQLGPDTLQAGLVSMATVSPYQFGQMIQNGGDGDTADVFVQCCLFGEVRYG